MYDKFIVLRGRHKDVPVYYAYVECPLSFQGAPIPQEAINIVYGLDEDNIPNKTDMTIEDYSLMVFSNDETMIVSLGAQTHSYGRLNPVGVDEMANWESFLAPLGLGSDKWYTRDEYQARMLELRPPEEI